MLLDVGLTAKRIQGGTLLSAALVWRIFGGIFTRMNIPITPKSNKVPAACTNAKVYTSEESIYNCDKFEYVKIQLECMASNRMWPELGIYVKAFSFRDASEPIGFSLLRRRNSYLLNLIQG